MIISCTFLTKMRVSIFFLLLIFGISMVLGKEDPCRNKKLDKQLKKKRCYKLGGFCFDHKCKGCKYGTVKKGLCGNKRRYCCLPDKPTEKPTPKPQKEECCRIYKDPHIQTYDKLKYDVQVPGEFLASAPCDSEEWQVLAKFEYPYPGAIYTQTVQVTVNLLGDQVIVKDTGTVTLNGVVLTLPYTDPNFMISQSGNDITVYLPTQGVKVIYDIETKYLRICVKGIWYSKLCGLCGNWNNDKEDDKVSIESEDSNDDCPHPKDHESWKYCRAQLKKINKRCKGLSLIALYLEHCAFDYCAEGKEGAQFTLQAARDHCANYGKSVFDGRVPQPAV